MGDGNGNAASSCLIFNINTEKSKRVFQALTTRVNSWCFVHTCPGGAASLGDSVSWSQTGEGPAGPALTRDLQYL